jgi:hypothetical protein
LFVVEAVKEAGETPESVCDRARPGVVCEDEDGSGGVGVGMESIRSWALVRVDVKRAARSAEEEESAAVCGAMSACQERGERDLKGMWWDIFPGLVVSRCWVVLCCFPGFR